MRGGLVLLRIVLIVALLLAAVWAFAGRADSKAGTPQEQLRPLLQELDAAAKARDTDRFMAAYLRQPALLWLINGTEIHGWDDLRAQQLKWWSGGKSDVVYSDRGPAEFTVLSPDAVIVTEMKESSRTMPDGTTGKNQFAISMVWRKLPEGWKIVYGHESTAR
jgi:ketosteroid isomerase-like protein